MGGPQVAAIDATAEFSGKITEAIDHFKAHPADLRVVKIYSTRTETWYRNSSHATAEFTPVEDVAQTSSAALRVGTGLVDIAEIGDESPSAKDLQVNVTQQDWLNDLGIKVDKNNVDVPPGWQPVLQNLLSQFPSMDLALIVAVLRHTEGHGGK